MAGPVTSYVEAFWRKTASEKALWEHSESHDNCNDESCKTFSALLEEAQESVADLEKASTALKEDIMEKSDPPEPIP